MEETQTEALVQQEVSTEQVTEQAAPQEAPKKVSQEHNWNQARAVMGTQAQKIQELEEKLDDMQKQPEPEEKYDPEDLATNKHVERVAERKISSKTKELQTQIEKLQKQLHDKEQVTLESEARTKHQDYDYVIEQFAVPMIQKDPSLAMAIKSAANPYAMAYRLAKASEEYEGEMKQQKPSAKAEKIIKNSERPLSSNAVPASLKGQADYFTNLTPDQVWQKSQEFARRA